MTENDDKEFQNLETETPTEVYEEPDPNDPEILRLRREAGDPTAPAEDPQ